MRFLRRLRHIIGRPGFDGNPPKPARPVFAIGDIHGSYALLIQLLEKLERLDPDADIVCLGDYIDRGPDSGRVIQLLYSRASKLPDRFVCIAGNHEEMLLTFLGDPERAGPLWLRNGGGTTLQSLGITGVVERTKPEDFVKVAGWLADALGPERLDWLMRCPRYWQSGNVGAVHAGANPALPLQKQARQTLLWGHPDFLLVPRADGMWIVHGHIASAEPSVTAGRISVDTGAWRTGVLTAAHIDDGRIEFVSTAADDRLKR